MPKTHSGGKRAARATVLTPAQAAQVIQQAQTQAQPAPQPQPAPQQPQPMTPQDVQQGNFPNAATTLSAFQQMTDDQKAAVINQATQTAMPSFLSDSTLQKLAYTLQIDNKPTMAASDSALDKMAGKEYFRTVNPMSDNSTRIRFSPDEILDQISKGSYTRYSGDFSSAYGRGLYFADSVSGSAAYGNLQGKMMRVKITEPKSVASYSHMQTMAQREMSSGSKLGQALQNADRKSQTAIYALSKGYKALDAGHYLVVLDRSCMTVSPTYKSSNRRTW